MTVKELLYRIGEPSNSLLDLYEDIQIEKFIGIYDMLDKKHQEELEKFVRYCRAFCVGEGEKHQPDKCSKEDNPTHISRHKGRVPMPKVVNEKNWLEGLSPEASLFVKSTSINTARDRGVKLENVKLLAYFHDGNDSLEKVLKTPESLILNLPKFGKKTADALFDWKTIITNISASDELELFQNPFSILEGRPCADMLILDFVEMAQNYSWLNLDKEEMNYLKKIAKEYPSISGWYSIEERNLKRIYTTPKKIESAKELVFKLQETIKEHLDECDAQMNSFEMIELPTDMAENTSIYECLETAIRQASEYFPDKKDVIQKYFLEDKSFNEIEKDYYKQKGFNRESIRLFITFFRDHFLGGAYDPIAPNAYISQELVDNIENISNDYVYCPVNDFYDALRVPQKKRTRYANNIIQTFFEFDYATPTDKKTLDFWDKDTNFCIRKGQKDRVTKGVLQNIYKYLKQQIYPKSIEEIQSYLKESGIHHETVESIEFLERVLSAYSKVSYNATDETYLLHIEELNTVPRCARYVYEHRDKGSITQLEINNALNLPEYTKIVPKKLMTDLELASDFLLKEGRWTYLGPNENRIVNLPYIPLRTLVRQFAEEKIIFTNEELNLYIKGHYLQPYSATSLFAYVTRNCAVAANDENLFCLRSALNNHPEFPQRKRMEHSAVNNSILNEVRRLLIQAAENNNSALSIDDIYVQISIPQEADATYYKRRIEPVLRKFTCEDGAISPDKPFVYVRKGAEVKYRLNEGHEKLNWEAIGYGSNKYYASSVIDCAVQLLKGRPDFTCTRKELCKEWLASVAEDNVNRNTQLTAFYDIINHYWDATLISSGEKDGDYLFWLTPDQQERLKSDLVQTQSEDGEIDQESITLSFHKKADYPFGERPTPNKDIFLQALREMINEMQNQRMIALQPRAVENATEAITELLFSNNAFRYEHLRQHWYEYLLYKIDKHSANSIYQDTANVYERFLRDIYPMDNYYISKDSGIWKTVANIPVLSEFFGSKDYDANIQFRKFYYRLLNERNTEDHGEDLLRPEYIYTNIRNTIALYVFSYIKIKHS